MVRTGVERWEEEALAVLLFPAITTAFIAAVPFAFIVSIVHGDFQVGPDRARAARIGAESVAVAAELFANMEDGPACPGVADLVARRYLAPSKVDDPWGRPYRLACDAAQIVVASSGRDGVPATPDDVAVARAR